MKKYGFFGGSFNPPTIAHEIIAKEIAKEFNLDKVYFVPVGDFYNKKDLIDERKRFEMLNLITDSNIDVLDIELKAKKSLQTIDAFNLINNKFNLSKNYFILGGDNLEKLPNWENAEKCLNSNIIAIKRGKKIEDIIENNKLLKLNKERIFIYNTNKLSNYSSTEVRNAIKNNNKEILKEMLNEKVYSYVEKNMLYKGE
ncbi:MAG: nicotinate (nicotinamide) nucleotide adenylyltransferase [Clostridia bacterium]|jgi:nicotinate-nucleotide adenylyltransferase